MGSARAFHICLLLLLAEMNGDTPLYFGYLRRLWAAWLVVDRDVRDDGVGDDERGHANLRASGWAALAAGARPQLEHRTASRHPRNPRENSDQR